MDALSPTFMLLGRSTLVIVGKVWVVLLETGYMVRPMMLVPLVDNEVDTVPENVLVALSPLPP